MIDWLARFETALRDADPAAVNPLLHAECGWRDALALTWSLETRCGRDAVVERFVPRARDRALRAFRIDADIEPPRLVMRDGHEVLEAFFRFTLDVGRGRGVVRLAQDSGSPAGWSAWTLMCALDELDGHEESTDRRRPTGQAISRDFRGPNWLDRREAARAYTDRDPTVLVVGGGQAGLASAARLNALGVDTLVIDRHARIGDNWRLRYHALTLHNQVQVNHLPYMPFPPTWPSYIPKDKLANWFEAYVDALEINYWTGTELVEARRDDTRHCWQATLRLADGSTRVMHPAHIVMATGVSGLPNLPPLPGLDAFSGTVVHSSGYRDGDDWTGKRAIVVGSGNSGHDIAQDLASSGAEVTMVQRSPTLVVNIEPSAQLAYALYEEGPSLEACDLLVVGTPMPLARRAHQAFTARSRELDAPLLQGLEGIGFRLDFGEDDTGWQFKYLTRGGGYYFNVGCSDMLVDGRIALLQHDRIDAFTTTGARLVDGSELPADLVVLATGYRPQEALVEKLFGATVRERVGPIWGIAHDELRNMYCRTAQPGLWFIAGSLAQCRINSKFLALQIKACEAGLLDADRTH